MLLFRCTFVIAQDRYCATVAHLWKRNHFYLYGTITTSLLLVLSYCKPFSGICVPVMNGVERTQVCWPRWTSTWLFNTVTMPFTTYLLAGRCGLASEQVCDKSSSYPRGCVWVSVCVCFPLAGTWSCCGTFAEQVCFASLSCLTFSIAGTGNPETLIARPMVHTNSRCHCTIAAFLCHCALVGFSYNKRENLAGKAMVPVHWVQCIIPVHFISMRNFILDVVEWLICQVNNTNMAVKKILSSLCHGVMLMTTSITWCMLLTSGTIDFVVGEIPVRNTEAGEALIWSMWISDDWAHPSMWPEHLLVQRR